MGKLKKESGITLIALVVTIIVLLILAGVSISMLTGENGILKKAGEASEKTKIATEDEQRKMAMFEAAMNTENTEYTDPKTDEKITIPAGFAPTRIDGESNVEEGFVITDSEGNEFVWIPCTTDEYKNSKDTVMDKEWPCGDDYKDNGDTGTDKKTGGQGNGKAWRDNYIEADKTELEKKYTEENALPLDKWIAENQITKAETSITKYKGFYIARYEAGVPINASFYTNTADIYNITGRGTIEETKNINNLKPVSKKGVQAWNLITQPNSKLVAENMYSEESAVDSYLVDSQAWNTICNKFDTILKSGEEGKNILDSSKIGNYFNNKATNYTKLNCLYAKHTNNGSAFTTATTYNKGKIPTNTAPAEKGDNRLELATGVCDDFKIYNIYDMAGNIWEWTTGHNVKNDKMFFVPRGGSFDSNGKDHPVVRSLGYHTMNSCGINVGFRVVLYVK